MSILKNNLKILQHQYSSLLQEILSESDDQTTDIKIENTSSGEPTLCIKGVYVHSARDPVREGQRLAQQAAAQHGGDGPIVIIGFGLGYAAQAAAQVASESGRPVIIVERYKSLLLKAFETRDLSDLLESKNIIFVTGSREISSADAILGALSIADEIIQNESDSKKVAATEVAATSVAATSVAVIRNKTLFELDKEWYTAAEEKLYTWAMKDRVNTATHKRFGQRWVKNLSRNMSAIRDLPGVERIYKFTTNHTEPSVRNHTNKHGKMPVFLAAAGPGLDKIKPLLRDIYERCIIVAVDTSLRFFVQNGIQPDFVLTVDPQFWNSRHLDRCVCERTTLIAESAVFPPVLNLPFKRKFLFSSLFPLGAFIENKVDPKGRLAAGGSVATTAWDFARLMHSAQFIMHNEEGMSVEQGTESSKQRAENSEQRAKSSEQRAVSREQRADIWIAGLDLSYPDYKTHFKGARFEEKSNCESCRFSPAETWIARSLRDGLPFKARGSICGEVLTDRRLSLYAAWFENQFSMHKNVNNFSLFQNGLAIAGLRAKEPEHLLALPVRRTEIDAFFQECYAQINDEFYNAEETQKRSERYNDAVSLLVRGLATLKKAADDGINIVQKQLARSSSTASEQEKVLKELDKVTLRITESEVKEIAGFLTSFDEGAATAAGNTNAPYNKYLQSSLKLFTSLSESAGFYLGLF